MTVPRVGGAIGLGWGESFASENCSGREVHALLLSRERLTTVNGVK